MSESILKYIAPQMQQPSMPTMSPAVMSGQMSPEQAQASGINAMPQPPSFSPIDRWLPLINAAGGALSTPMTPTQPLAPLGGALQGFGQGRLEQIQLERQAAAPYQQVALDMYARQREAAMARQANEQKAQQLRIEADAEEDAGRKDRADQLRSYADMVAANAPEAARFTMARPLAPEQARAYTSTANLRDKQAAQGPTTKTKDERQSDRETQAVDRTLRLATNVYNKIVDPGKKPIMEWLASPEGQATLKAFAVREGAPLDRVLGALSNATDDTQQTPVPGPNVEPSPTGKANDPLGIL